MSSRPVASIRPVSPARSSADTESARIRSSCVRAEYWKSFLTPHSRLPLFTSRSTLPMIPGTTITAS